MLRLFDVSLRDGLQSVKRIYSLREKIDILNKIIQYNPRSIEIGSIVSKKRVPQMANSIELLYYAQNNIKYIGDYYILVPNEKSLNIGLKNNVINFSLINSVSELFQNNNINASIKETKQFIEKVYQKKEKERKINKIKIYLSCINFCPISGIIENDKIIEEIMYYSKYDNINLCLSDTCGNLKFEDFKYIIDNINFNMNNISLHLHISNENRNNIKNIISYAYKKNIIEYDVSCVKTGGCHMTLEDNKLNANLNYSELYKIFNE